MKRMLPALLTALFFANSVIAGSVDSSAFNGVTDGAVSTSGALDWGYISVSGGFFDSDLDGQGIGTSYNNTPYGSITKNDGTILSTASGASTIGTVTLTEGLTGTDTVGGQGNTSNFTFDEMTAFGSYGNLAPGEKDAWTITFNDLGIGTFDITLYLGHSKTNRSFEFDVSLDDGGAPVTTTTESGLIGDLGSTVAGYGNEGAAFTYDIQVTTTTAEADLSLVFSDSGGGNFGGAIFAGYTVFEGGGGGENPIGDYNSDSVVDLADYTIWRNTLGATGLTPFEGADGNGDGSITEADYTVWQNNFGASSGGVSQSSVIPEPSSIGMILIGFALSCQSFRKASR